MSKIDQQNITLVKNKKAFFDYEIIDRMEAGIVLCGSEVKSIKDGKVSIKECYCRFIGNELFIVGMHVSEYKNANIFNHKTVQDRKLLLHRQEMKKLYGKAEIAGFTIIPLSVYKKRHLIKVEIALVRGKREFDKRHTIKERDVKKETDRLFKNHR
jgi:SsrA-binding protein